MTKILLKGCDDTTEIELEELLIHELEFLQKLQKLSYKNSDCNCKPVLIINPILDKDGNTTRQINDTNNPPKQEELEYHKNYSWKD